MRVWFYYFPCGFTTAKGWKTEDGRRKTEDGRRKTEDGRRKTEDGRRKTEDGRRKTEDGRWKTEDGRRKREDGPGREGMGADGRRRKTEDGRRDGRRKTEGGRRNTQASSTTTLLLHQPTQYKVAQDRKCDGGLAGLTKLRSGRRRVRLAVDDVTQVIVNHHINTM
jgi:hypothetical protein